MSSCQSKEEKSKETAEKTVITVATDADTNPFTFAKDEVPTGYDVEVVKKVFEKLPEYELKIEVTDFDSVISGVSSGRYQIAANDIGWNEEREEKYYYSSPLSKSSNAIATKSEKEVKTLGNLAKQSTEVLPSANFTTILTKYNEENPNQSIQLNYVDGNYPIASRLLDVENGKIDFILYDAISLTTIIKEQDLKLNVYPITSESEDEHDGYEYLIFTKDEQGKKLQEKVNKILAELEKDGTLKKLSNQFFKGDFVPKIIE